MAPGEKQIRAAQSFPSPEGREVLAHTWLYSGTTDLNLLSTTTGYHWRIQRPVTLYQLEELNICIVKQQGGNC